jgi:hypothetical protein
MDGGDVGVGVMRRSIVSADRNTRRKEALAKKKADEQATYEAAYYEERRYGEIIQEAAGGMQHNVAMVRKSPPSSPALFGKGFVPHPT